jgi:hypothetical protein
MVTYWGSEDFSLVQNEGAMVPAFKRIPNYETENDEEE